MSTIPMQEHVQSLEGESHASQEVFTNGSADSFNVENLQIAQYLDLKEAVFDSDVMDKISELREFFGDLEGLKGIDFKLGNPVGSKLDKLYTYMLLNKEEAGYEQKIADINNQKEHLYGRR